VRREFNSFTRGSFSLFGHRAKGHASPRLGVSYPVTDRDKIFFSYGHFSQLPDYKYVYSKLGERATATYQLFGNPNLNPTVTVAYELGLEHLLTSDMILGVVAYYKDIFDYPTALQVITGPKPEDHFWMYFNSDYARSFGLEFILKKRPTRFFSASLNLTLSQAKGKSSTAEDYWLGQQTLKEWFLEWDRPYKAYASVGFTVPGGQHPVLWGLRLPDDWNASLSSSFESGRRYTPVDQDGNRGETNSGLGPYRFSLDLNVRKNISLGSRFKYYAYLRGTNLTNRRNVYLVNPRTGQAFEPGDPRPPGVSAIKMLDPSRYREPRAVELGVGTRW
jgi:outer membrane receptor protein involved in Fe transport